MARHYGTHGYGITSRVLHWLVAALMLGAALRGLTMVGLPAGSEAEVAAILAAYSAHKTMGIAILTLVLLRLVATLSVRGPGPLHPERTFETFLARTAHFVLWGAMLAMPLSGWVRHASAPGFAPILWPLGQGLPGIPANEALSLTARSVHAWAAATLAVTLALHILGTLKHILIDRDATLARMTTGRGPYAEPARGVAAPLIAAAVIWAAILTAGVLTAPEPEPDPFADAPGQEDGEFALPDFEDPNAGTAPDGAPGSPSEGEQPEIIDEPPPPAD